MLVVLQCCTALVPIKRPALWSPWTRLEPTTEQSGHCTATSLTSKYTSGRMMSNMAWTWRRWVLNQLSTKHRGCKSRSILNGCLLVKFSHRRHADMVWNWRSWDMIGSWLIAKKGTSVTKKVSAFVHLLTLTQQTYLNGSIDLITATWLGLWGHG